MSLDKILEKEQRLNDLKKWLEEFKKESLSADDDTPFVLDDKEKAKIKEIEEIIQKSEKRINELKASSGETVNDPNSLADSTKKLAKELKSKLQEFMSKNTDIFK